LTRAFALLTVWQAIFLLPDGERPVLNKSAKRVGKVDGAPVLGGGVTTYRERPAHPALRQHFARVWFHAVPRGAPVRSAIVPDGCPDLVWCGGALCMAGPDRHVRIETVPPGTTVVGLQFQPGSAFRWLRTSVSEIVGARVSLEYFWGMEARRLAERVGETEDPDDLARRLEVALMHRLPNVVSPDEIPRSIFRAINSRRDYSIPVTQQLGVDFGLSERTLRRRCHEAFGYGPKTLDRILRFQRFLRLARARGTDATADLAVDTGYSDQSHLTREARELAGLTPSNIRDELTL
jgi:AraC-like DNA-binding protein